MTPSEDRLRERRKAHRLTRRIIRFLREEYEWDVRFVRLDEPRTLKRFGFRRPVVGVTDFERLEICLDPSFDDTFAVLIHECLHVLFPEKSEEDILGLESLLRRHLTPHYARELILALARRLR
ncbi:MAG TPA: hypothetical protein VL283_02040 [Candidatus Baltobacteraceae bacterium]|nr:hypothetical protein [Candidatus Baltobacteraceae bacterium]